MREIFASNDKSVQEKDIIFTITPHILRTPNITAEDLAPIWIGTEDDIRLKNAPPISVFERSKRKEEKAIEDIIKEEEQKADPQPAPPPPPPEIPQQESERGEELITTVPPAVEQPAPVEKSPPINAQVAPPVVPAPQPSSPELPTAALSFLSPNVNPKVTQEMILHLRAENAAQIANAFLFFEFDPAAVQVKDVLQGAFMTPGAFAKSFDNGRGTVNINATHVPSETSTGVIATIVLVPLKPGQTMIKLNSAVLRAENATVIPVTFVPYTIRIE